MGIGIGPARRAGLGSEVTTSLRQAIFDGTFKSGDHLGEIEIAQELDVSRGPVREALLQLKSEGLVSMELHRGSSVVSLTVDDIEELTSLRTVLERMAMRLAIQNHTPANLRAMEDVIVEMERAVESADAARLTQLDIAFHDQVFAASGHTRLVAAWRTIRSQMLLFLLTRAEANRDYLTIALDEHRELVEIVRDTDPTSSIAADDAARSIAAHVRGGYDRLMGTLRPDEHATPASTAPTSNGTPEDETARTTSTTKSPKTEH